MPEKSLLNLLEILCREFHILRSEGLFEARSLVFAWESHLSTASGASNQAQGSWARVASLTAANLVPRSVNTAGSPCALRTGT